MHSSLSIFMSQSETRKMYQVLVDEEEGFYGFKTETE